MSSASKNPTTTRRGFLLGAGVGMLTGSGLTWLGSQVWSKLQSSRFTGSKTEEVKSPEYAMPGPYPGRVVEIRHPQAVKSDHTINGEVIPTMVQRGMATLTDTDPQDPSSAWKRFFSRGDVIGIKVNPVGRKPFPGEGGRPAHAAGSISSPELIVEIVQGLKSAGVRPQDIVLFDRYADQFIEAEYDKLVRTRPMEGVRWMACSAKYTNEQLDIEGFDIPRRAFSPEFCRHVIGYDPDAFTTMGFCGNFHNPKDDRRFRSHLSAIVTKMVDKVINVPVLKDHRSAGVTIALKNMSHGFNNNVARSHLSNLSHGFQDKVRRNTGPNQCNTFIPQAVAQHAIREKVVLHITDGLIGVYEGGPGSWNKTWATWHHQGIFFSTDPVAMDHVGWDIIDAKRIAEGWPVVGEMGQVHRTQERIISHELTSLGGASSLEAITLAATVKNRREGFASEAFDLRTPQHVRLAGDLGLGVFPAEQIEHRLMI